jgi:acyl-CoA synthetase (NDP forming)
MTTQTIPDLSLLVAPRSVALVGASDKVSSIGGRATDNLLHHSRLEGPVYLVNPYQDTVAGIKCWPDIAALPEVPDVVVVAVPAASVLPVIEQSESRGVRFAIVLSSGFAEEGDAGRVLEEQMTAIAARSGMRIYGPNCPGLCNMNRRVGLTFSPAFKDDLLGGPIGLATQGGGLGRNIVQAQDKGAGVGLWCSPGNEADLQVADFIAYMTQVPEIKVILALMEGIKSGPRFVQAAQQAARAGKPLVVLKVGRSDYGVKAAQSHTASLTGSAEVNSTVFRQLGAVEVHDVDELVDTGWLLSRGRAKGDAIAVWSASGGTTALTADMVGTHGLRLAEFSPETLARLAQLLPSYAAINNPMDTTTAILSDDTLVESTLRAVCDDPGVSAVLLPLSIDYGAVTHRLAESVVRVQENSPVPIIPIWMSMRIGSAYSVYADAGMAPIHGLEKAVRAVGRWLSYRNCVSQNSGSSVTTFEPALLSRPALAGPGSTLSEPHAKAALAACGLPVPAFRVASSAVEAAAALTEVGAPAAMKIASPDILHKSEVGGVLLGVTNPDEAADAFQKMTQCVAQAAPAARIEGVLVERMAPHPGVELIIGLSRDPVFGPMITCGLGGLDAELFRDVSRRMLPLDREQAEGMLAETRSYALLVGSRGRPRRDIDSVVSLLVKLSENFLQEEWFELELNPVWVGASGEGVLLLDAVLVEGVHA